MFSSVVQPPLVSLFSSTGSSPLHLWETHTDQSLPADSFIVLLNDATALPTPAAPKSLIALPPLSDPSSSDAHDDTGYALAQTVLHIQSPSLPTTYIRCPPRSSSSSSSNTRMSRGLELKHPWLHLQVRNLGREWSFEVGVVDQSGKEGVVRFSTFQKEPALHVTTAPPLLHLPLAFPHASTRPLTTWCTLPVHLPTLLPFFSSHALIRTRSSERDDGSADENDTEDLPPEAAGRVPRPGPHFSHVSYVKVYATCRLRRIWFSESRMGDTQGTAGAQIQKTPWEFQMYAAEKVSVDSN
ncbi:hypothetical protein EVG20_g5615 [Dentipellis fragilis]|uniref:CFA20 domain-containing protein n=1 Tax=Dentipellis fragilis TaxID=205917 RepID=A0A4Y9YUK6_9AGAM|nr:hypothetical protein EVG20_g5615 [Dentipellis fragilis]